MRIRLSILFIILAAYSFCGICKSTPLSIAELRTNAESGDANSQFSLALMYQMGRSVPRDYNEAVKWHTKAAEQNHAKAQYELGGMYENGQGVLQNYTQAFGWYTKAAEQNYAKAQYRLGLFYSIGLNVGRNYEEAVQWFTKAAEQGSAEAQLELGIMYFNGKGVQQNDDEAGKWLKRAAVQENPKAQYYLGLFYCKDRDDEIKHDYTEAVKWFSKAGARGEINAQYLLGVMYCRGEGVPQNYKTAVKWFIKAASQGSARAQLILSACYWNGKGVSQDGVESLKWATLASMNGNKDAKWLKKEICERLTQTQMTEAQKRINKVRKIKGYLTENDFDAKDAGDQTTTNIESTSTGFFIAPDGFILTAYHSVGKSETVQIVYNQKEYAAKVIGKNESIDAAVLKIDGSNFPYLPVSSSASVQTGDTVFTMGYPQINLQGTEPKFTEGSVSALSGLADNPQYFQISVPVQPGNSGGPLVNKKGEVVGLIIARLNDISALLTTGSVPQNVNYALKSTFILSFLESIPELSEKIPANGALKERAAAIDRAKKSVVLVTSYK